MTSESEEQIGFIKWMHQRHPNILVFHIPNGGFRDIHTAGKLKMEGVVAGIPDIFIPEWHTFLEFKRKDAGVLSPSQKKIIAHLRSIGYTVFVAHGATEASKMILEFLRRLKP